MADCSDNRNPLNHSGTSQAQRLLPGLDRNGWALADEKDFADWIVFAGEFARYLKYYSTDDVFARDWKVFFSSDISARLGIIAVQDIERYRNEIKERLDFIRDDDNKTSLDAVRLKLNELFSALLTLSKALDETQLSLPKETSLKASILNLIKTRLAPALKQLLAYHLAAENLGYLNHSFLSSWKILNKPLTDAGQVIQTEGLSENWLVDTITTNWNDYVSSITEDNSIFNNPLSGFSKDFLSIEHAANHNLFTGIFDTYLTCYTKIIGEAESELLKTFENYDAHTAHYALFLAFLKLFRFAQSHINTITQRHLDFYYREVLKLQPKPAEANKVHILGELAKQVDDYLLAVGTALKAGKDSLNKEVIYALDADTVFNKSKVAQLKTFYKANAADTIYEPGTSTVIQDNEGRIFASPAANSEDGLGAELTSASKEWHPFVHKVYEEAALQSISMPKAQLGFALASHYLYLTEGERKVLIRLVTNPASILVGKQIECWLTGEKEWIRAESPVISSTGKKLSDNLTSCTEISFTIPGSVPAIVNYNAAVHGGSFNCALPILKIYLVNADDSLYEYDLLKDATVSMVEIRVEVGMDGGYNQKGLKNLLLANDAGPVDASKPFMPFGNQPAKDSSLVIGHKEIFSKKNAAIKLNIEWADLPTLESTIKYFTNSLGTSTPYAQVYFQSEGVWKSNLDDSSISLSEYMFNGVAKHKQMFPDGQPVPESAIRDYADEYTVQDASTINGFLRLSLASSFGHSDYILDFATFMLEKNPEITPKTITVEPVEPYTPKIKSLYASYSAFSVNNIAESTSYPGRDIMLFHLNPFGESEQHKFLQPTEEIFLLPQFTHISEGIQQEHIGEFYIGFEKLEPGQAVNVLFQVMEGTTDPKLAKPEQHVHWSYLGSNRWIDFKSDEYSDNTLDLVQSGIVSFSIPKGATTTNTLLPSGLTWIRASITEAAEAVCKLLSVDAQASVATFADQGNAEDFLDNPLAAGTISKLKNPDASVKKLSQLYPSFGGRQKESDDHFYIRVSERLRHKARAITVWDYEHLVLEAFPEIYKVKCLNHTQLEGGVYNEVRPGYVSLVTIPFLQNRNDADPLKPYTQQSTLTNIENYLTKRTSCFVKIHAGQPQFEEIRMEFSLKLADAYKDFTFYSNQLREEITQFLSPWAFGDSSQLDFGGKVVKSALIDFIEERYYVDYITDVYMYVKINETTAESGDLDEVGASSARSILVSAIATKHVIHEVIESEESTTEECFAS